MIIVLFLRVPSLGRTELLSVIDFTKIDRKGELVCLWMGERYDYLSSPGYCLAKHQNNALFIDREAREIIRLIASIRLSVCPSTWDYDFPN